MREQSSLADLGKWPRSLTGSSTVIRHAYENALTTSARLYSFASGCEPTSDGPIEQHQEVLAGDDLLAFAIHARRLIDSTISMPRANRIEVQGFTKDGKVYVPVTRIINILIHHREVAVIRTAQHLRISMGVSTIRDFMITDEPRIEPVCVAVSDKGKTIGFNIRALVERFQEQIIGPVIELCAEHSIFLENLD